MKARVSPLSPPFGSGLLQVRISPTDDQSPRISRCSRIWTPSKISLLPFWIQLLSFSVLSNIFGRDGIGNFQNLFCEICGLHTASANMVTSSSN